MKPPQVGQSELTDGLGQEPDLSTEFAPGCTWAGKKAFCEMEAGSYFNDDVPIAKNPYFENTWPWQWFNDEYQRLRAEDDKWTDYQDYAEAGRALGSE